MRDLTHLGAYHNWVEQSFPWEKSIDARTRKLWRIDQLRGKNYLLLVSEDKPDLESLELYGVKGSGRTKDYNDFLKKLENNMKAQFRVTLNPIVSIFEGKNKRGRVVPCMSEKDQTNFLLDRAEKNGFILKEDKFIITSRNFENLKKPGKKSLRISKATYEGLLTIENVEIFRETLTRGFGKKKAYGCGMMTVIPEV